MGKTHKHSNLYGRSPAAEPHAPHGHHRHPRPEPHDLGHSFGIEAHGRKHAVRTGFHTVTHGQGSKAHRHSPAISGA
jgi:hypothetical protein